MELPKYLYPKYYSVILSDGNQKEEKGVSCNFYFLTVNFSIDRDAQLLANRIALLKQEEMKTWKKIEETKKRTNDIQGLKKRNEEKVQKVSKT